jgi:hypothetical protein
MIPWIAKLGFALMVITSTTVARVSQRPSPTFSDLDYAEGRACFER